LLQHYELLYCLNHINQCPTDKIIQKYTHIFLREIAYTLPDILEITIKEIKELNFEGKARITPLIQQESLAEGLAESTHLINLITVKLPLKPLILLKFGIHQNPVHYLTRDNTHLMVDKFYLYHNSLVHQKATKPYTTITSDFYQNIQGLAQTTLWLDYYLINEVSTLLTETFAKLVDATHRLISSKPMVGHQIVSDPDTKDVAQAFKKVMFFSKLRKAQTKAFRKAYKLAKDQNLIANGDYHNKILINDEVAAGQMALFLLRFNSLTKKSTDADELFAELQQIFTQTHTIKEYFEYIAILQTLGLSKLYFSIYADFRGRLYYNSPVSPQSSCYFRFIYHLGPYLRSNLPPLSPLNVANLRLADGCPSMPLFQAIGFIFKAQCTNSDGKIYLLDILNLGAAKYLVYKSLQLVNYKLDDPKTSIELMYYVTMLNDLFSEKTTIPLRYVIKDSTCSMVQHAGKLLGYRPTKLEFLNLNNNLYAYDTYAIFIQSLREHLANDKGGIWQSQLQRYLTRSNLKNLIMTIEYGVTKKTAYREYCATFASQLAIPEDERKLLQKEEIFLLIFNFFKEGLVAQELFFHTSAE
jgi:hypothetical protein